MAEDAEGRFGALDSRAIYRHAKTAGYLYQAELRHQLGERLGLEWQPVEQRRRRHRRRPARGHPQAFSPAGPEIEAAHGRARRVQRPRRPGGRPRHARRQGLRRVGRAPRGRWRARAAELGFGRARSRPASTAPGEREPEPRRCRAPLRRARRAAGPHPERVHLHPPRGHPDARRALRLCGGLRGRRAGRSLPRLGARRAAGARPGACPRRATRRPSCWRPSASCSRARSRAGRGRRAGGRARSSRRCSPAGPSCRPSRRRWCAA